MSKLVSVIVPAYNAEEYIADCIDSIKAQTYADWQLVIINDGSEDDTEVVVLRYAEQDDRITYYKQDNAGVSLARNKGLEMALGEYVCFVDSDDTVLPHYIEHLVDLSENFHVDFALTAVGEYSSFKKGELISCPLNRSGVNDYFLLNKEFALYGPVCKLYKRDILNNNKVRFPASLSFGEDLVFNFTYMRYVERLVFSNVMNYKYRVMNDESLSRKFRLSAFAEEKKLCDVIRNFSESKGLISDNMIVYLNRRLCDVAYNQILRGYHLLNRSDHRVLCNEIMNDIDLCNAIATTDMSDYSNLIVRLIRSKQITLLRLYLYLRNIR